MIHSLFYRYELHDLHTYIPIILNDVSIYSLNKTFNDRYTYDDLKALGCFDRDLDDTPKVLSGVLPDASSFGRRLSDVKLMASRWKANLEACLELYPIVKRLAPSIFSAKSVDLGAHDELKSVTDTKGEPVPVVPTAAAGNASLGPTRRTTHTTTVAHINPLRDDDGGRDLELEEEEEAAVAAEAAAEEEAAAEPSRRAEDQYASAVRTQVIRKDLASKDVVQFLIGYSMWMANLGEYQEEDAHLIVENLQKLQTSELSWYDQDLSSEGAVRQLMHVEDELRSELQTISQDDSSGPGGKNAQWLLQRMPFGICRQTGSVIDKARRRQPSHLKSQVGVAPSGQAMPTYVPTLVMQHGTLHEADGWDGVVARFPIWFKDEYCVKHPSWKHGECEIKYEGQLGIFVCEEDEIFAYSPDGRITVTMPGKDKPLAFLVEIKCPS